MEELGIEEARRKLGEIVSRARYAGERTVITRYAEPIAVIVPVEWYLEMKRKLGDEA
jgi:prevent-host-death family protein